MKKYIADINFTSDTIKLALQASRQERKREPLSPKTTETLSKKPQLKMLTGMMFYLRKTRLKTQSTTFNENSKTIIERNKSVVI